MRAPMVSTDSARRRLSRPLAGLVLTVAVVAGTVPARADWRGEFRDGFRAWEDKDWQTAARHLRAAIAEKPSEVGTRVPTVGNFSETYMPHLYLGLSLAELGECSGVVTAYDATVRDGISESRAKRLLGQLETAAKDCRIQLAAARADEVEQELESARAARSSFQQAAGGNVPSTLADRAQAADARLQQAGQQLSQARGEGDEAALDAVARTASELVRDYGRLATEARQLAASTSTPGDRPAPVSEPATPSAADRVAERLPAARSALQQAQRRQREVAGLASGDWPAEAGLGSEWRAVGADLERAASLLERGRSEEDVDRVQEAERLARDVVARLDRISTRGESWLAERRRQEPAEVEVADAERASEREPVRRDAETEDEAAAPAAEVAETRPAAPSSPAERLQSLRRVAELYLDGRYSEALELAGGLEATGDSERLYLDLMTAAAGFQLYRAEGEEDGELLGQVEERVGSLRRARPEYRPDPTRFSPAFVALFAD